MKPKLLILLCLLMAIIHETSAQNPGVRVSSDGQEVYFCFPFTKEADLPAVSRQISVDNIMNDTVWAYANRKQFEKFSAQGFNITILPHPGDAPGVVMRDRVELTEATRTVWNFYPTYEAYEAIMEDFQTLYPSLCRVENIGTLASGRKLLVAKISDNTEDDEDEPEFFYSSSMHGDETTGYVLMLHLIEYLLQNYGTDPEVTDLVDNMEIYICPLANPDGTYYGGNGSVSGARRYNANFVDLNRNYPDPDEGDHPDGNAWQAETVAFMNFAEQRSFVAGANFHGGIEVVNYPWDTWSRLNADNNWWVMVSREYADTCQANAPSWYMDDLDNGITNGYAWYRVTGGRQDYMNYFRRCREVTIELSTTKMVAAAQLPDYWNYNYRSMLNLIKQATYGFRGVVTDQLSGLPVKAEITLTGHDADNSSVFSSALHGDYYRPVKAGTYTLQVSAPCYQTQTFSNLTIADFSVFTQNVPLIPSAGVTTSGVSDITSGSATCGGEVICEGGSPVTARGVCWGTAVNPSLSGQHSQDGSGAGSFVSLITGLAATTTYYVRAYATNGEGTVYGENRQFTTSCDVIEQFPFTEGFENGGLIPACWTQEQVNNSGVSWTFVAGNGGSSPATAHTGAYNACLKDNSSADNKTRLISPPLNLSALINPSLQFWHTQAFWSPDQDELRVFYRASADSEWILLQSYTQNTASWTMHTLEMPDASETYCIAFEGNAKYGYGVCLDDIMVSGTLRTLSVTPSNQMVDAAAGNVDFTVESNSGWEAFSDQEWCVVTPSGNGNGALFADYEANTGSTQRVATITVSAPGLEPVQVTLTQSGLQEKVLNLTVLLEGLYQGPGMNKAKNESGDQFPGEIADQIQVELREAAAPYGLVAGPFTVSLDIVGHTQLTLPPEVSSDCFIVIKHRNSIETWSSSPVSFAEAGIDYNFTDAASRAWGGNLKPAGNVYLIFAGDVNQDGMVDSADMTVVDNDAQGFATGYLLSDVNGDGITDSADMTLLDNNAANFVSRMTP
ncbi:M14 family zinc carboxypeptidase [Lentimicrobium sp.]|uniref:M14 family zinc carboxypeptidase n=1 Tax=Lentimicrobium sp. TaxID=2034841 RepID=UPI0025FD5756|nr:M14 family zinc carboxypeptidase [Lentimicrobium sp.]MCO5257876.1 choice-of-anchor J domain-containing protein [Lentimicrobium sp.]MCO5263225.1 choice-of-anchor J domain-containing protein [Lentimicrobium sp.]HPF64095.1 M14 family zinc carboxypeptidase [Lentimicrobium sp.]HPR25422.1 M14 family zinc carboxypeptidase [Lentimicrobium sp.]